MTVQPFKIFTKEEIVKARFLHLRICTSGLDNPKMLDDAFDYENACPECKAGRLPKGELNLPTNRMGKKKIDANFRYGYLIFEKDLVEKICKENLKGIDFKNTVLGREKEQFKEGRILNTLPRIVNKTILHSEDVCKTCGRSGHYDAQVAPTEYWYFKKDLDKLSHDFYLSWEFYGIWDMGQTYPIPIVSQKFREIIEANYKLRHLRFEPILEQE